MPLTPLALPDSDWATYADVHVAAGLAAARAALDQLADGSSRTTLAALQLWNDSDMALSTASGLANLLAQVHPDVAVRTSGENAVQELTRFATERSLDRGLYDVLAGLDPTGLGPDAARVLGHSLRDFRRSGVDRDEATRERLRAINERMTVLGQDFARNIRDDVRSIRIAPERLAGLPEDYVAAHPPGEDGLVTITTDYPDLLPFRSFARDGAARRELVIANLNRGWPQNDPILHELLDLRAEQADLLGYADWPDYDAEVKMIREGAAIADFVDRISQLADAPGRRVLAVLLERARVEDPGIEALTAAESHYYSELIRRERFDVDAQHVRTFFDFAKTRDGLLEVTGQLFGIEYAARPDASVWHPEVAAYDVLRDGEPIGRIYLDLHPREGKFKHAAQFSLVSGVAGRTLPEGVLVCNFPTGLMEHFEVTTFFHEFGHLLHHILAGAGEWVAFSGVATEWDFVEAPSQMLEEWAWDHAVLSCFATDADGRAIPAELVAKMVAAHEFGKGLQARTQMFFAAVSYYLHRDRPADHDAFVADIQPRFDLLQRLPETHFQASFGHLDGYTSAYYTYMWSLVIAKDLFAAFDRADLLDPEVAARYRDRVLAPGGSKDAADLVADFLGRPYSFEAFGAWLAR
ncbi:MAG: M3 family metallopeptidase [Tetrasphaera sp.]